MSEPAILPGMLVRVYHDPVTRSRLEGTASVVRVWPSHADQRLVDVSVLFPGGDCVLRSVDPLDVIPEDREDQELEDFSRIGRRLLRNRLRALEAKLDGAQKILQEIKASRAEPEGDT